MSHTRLGPTITTPARCLSLSTEAGKLWNDLIVRVFTDRGLIQQSEVDEGLFVMRKSLVNLQNTTIDFEMDLCLYVDDSVYSSNDEPIAERVVDEVEKTGRSLTRMGQARWFLSMILDQDRLNGRYTISQPAYIQNILQFSMFGDMRKAPFVARPCSTAKDIDHTSAPAPDTRPTKEEKLRQSQYRAEIGKALFLVRMTVPLGSFQVHRLGKFAANPGEKHIEELRHFYRWLASNPNIGITYHRNATRNFKVVTNAIKRGPNMDLNSPVNWSDSDHASDCSTRASHSGFAITDAGAVVAYGDEDQKCVSVSTTEAELIALARACREAIFIRKVDGRPSLISPLPPSRTVPHVQPTLTDVPPWHRARPASGQRNATQRHAPALARFVPGRLVGPVIRVL